MRPWSLAAAAAGAGAAYRLGAVRRQLRRADPQLRTSSAHLMAFLSPHTMNAAHRLSALRRPRPVPGVTVRDEHVEVEGRNVPLIVLEPAGRDRPSPALLWLHGGGYTMQRAADPSRTCRASPASSACW